MIELVEYTRSEVELDPRDRDYLLTLLKGGARRQRSLLQSMTPTSREGWYELTPGPFIGRVGLPSGDFIDVSSRFPFENVIELLTFSGKGPTLLAPYSTRLEGAHFLVDLIAEAFVREVERVVGRGLAKGYVVRRFLEPPYPGKLDIRYHLNRLHGREDRLATLARRLTTNVPINQAVALALDVLARSSFRDELVLRRVARLAAVFRSVSRSCLTATDVRKMRPSRLHAHYREVIPLAALILEGNSQAPDGGGTVGASILFDMPRVWEACVAHWATDVWGSECRVETQHYFDLSSEGELKSAADVVVWDGKRIVALYDAKYKAPGSAPDIADVYQMVAYCDRLGLTEATLVYPLQVEPKEFKVGGRSVRMLGLRQVTEEKAESFRLETAS